MWFDDFAFSPWRDALCGAGHTRQRGIGHSVYSGSHVASVRNECVEGAMAAAVRSVIFINALRGRAHMYEQQDVRAAAQHSQANRIEKPGRRTLGLTWGSMCLRVIAREQAASCF